MNEYPNILALEGASMHHAFSKSGFESAKNVKSVSKSRDHKGEAG